MLLFFKWKYSTPLIFLFALLAISCRKYDTNIQAPESYKGDTYSNIFEAFWNGMNEKYVFWSIDTTNWDNVYTKYKPLFAKLATFDSVSENKAEFYFDEMTSGLIDSHYNLTFPATGRAFNPSAYRRYQEDPNYFVDSIFPRNSLNLLISNKYIDIQSLKSGTDFVTSNGIAVPFTAISGTINNEVLYLFFSSFDISQAGVNTKPVFDYFISSVHTLPQNIKGIIIDLRGNPGGEIIDLDYILGQMITAPLNYGFSRTKGGSGRLDYLPWAPAIVKPWNGGSKIDIPIVALGDHGSTSMSELTAIAIKSLPNGKYVGTRTWGATGPVSPNANYNGGAFTIGMSYWGSAGYMAIYTSSAMFKSKNGDIYEGMGVPPDIYARETNSAYMNNQDLVIDAAIKYLHSQ